ncbi:uncharacterized protein LOC125226580 [Leguminivora glycinivorella]|uniref:uncharacterized protein LOC125226580 n=1 Tax=Leguminivora glycinivorella TaxID=1035111 RepID=UPI00201001D3|nr:uncharacterized protein LOC125226580 [Leguminivora glycinivorella]
MASDPDDFDQNIENLKATVKQSFARIYASLKARELKTLRQLDAIRKQCQNDNDLKRNCVQNIHISYDNESTLLENVSNYGLIDLEKLNFDNSIFTLEEYVSPNDDHMYSYKTIEELSKEKDENLAIEEAALRQLTRTDNCVCYVNIRSEEVSKQFREDPVAVPMQEPECVENKEAISGNVTEDEKSDSSDPEVVKIDPTDDWLNSIKGQTETEPSQVSDVMEHSTITCS